MPVDFEFKDAYTVSDLLRIMEILRAPGGCPWDREQDHLSIRSNFIEETYEVVEAIDNGDSDALREELGDVLLQVVFHTQMEKEKGVFDFDGVADGICKKLIERHPHVFGNVKVDGAEEVLTNWDKIKRVSKAQRTTLDAMRAVPKQMPALMRARKIAHKADKDLPEKPAPAAGAEELDKSWADFRASLVSGECAAQNAGKLLFLIAEACDRAGIDSEEALYRATDGFIDGYRGKNKE